MRRLNLREELFVAHLLEGFSMIDSILQSYPGFKSRGAASVYANTLTKKPHVARAIRRGIEFKKRALRASRDRTLARIADIAFAEGDKLLATEPGSQWALRPISEIPKSVRRAIQKVKICRETTTQNGDTTTTEQVLEITLHPVGPELDKLAKYHGLYADKGELTELERRVQDAEQYLRDKIAPADVAEGEDAGVEALDDPGEYPEEGDG